MIQVPRYLTGLGIAMAFAIGAYIANTRLKIPKLVITGSYVMKDIKPEIKELAARHGRRYELDPLLVESVIQQESAGDIHALSHCGAEGLMQLMPRTGRWLMKLTGREDETYNPYDAELNVDLACFYLRRLKMRFGSDELALAAYNAGETRIAKILTSAALVNLDQSYDAIEWRLPTETRQYVPKIMADYARRKRAALAD